MKPTLFVFAKESETDNLLGTLKLLQGETQTPTPTSPPPLTLGETSDFVVLVLVTSRRRRNELFLCSSINCATFPTTMNLINQSINQSINKSSNF